MAIAVVMPKVGQSVESCMLSEWCKKVGDPVHVGDILFRFETDKSTFDEEAKEDGTLLSVFFEEGDDIPCLETIGVIGQSGESTQAFRPSGEPSQENPAPNAVAEALPCLRASSPPEDNGPQPRTASPNASPRAKALAQKLGVHCQDAIPSGPEGRIVADDIRRLAASAPGATSGAFPMLTGGAMIQGTGIGGRITSDDMTIKVATHAPPTAMPVGESGFTDQRLSSVRKATARAMTQSLTTMAQLTHTTSFDATVILALRKQLKESKGLDETPTITMNDMILYGVSRVLPRHQTLNSHFLGDQIRQFHHVHLGIAVDTPRGLLVPTLFDADTKSLSQISREAKALVQACREGTIQPDQMKGASFTVSNLGSFGIEHFTPIINPPQTGILGVNCMVDRVRIVDGAISAYPAMGLSLTYDHRALDGAPASQFLADLRTALENFYTILI